MTNAPHKEFTIAFEVRIGAYTLAPSERPGWIWITGGDGEGGEFAAGQLEEALAKFYAEHY